VKGFFEVVGAPRAERFLDARLEWQAKYRKNMNGRRKQTGAGRRAV
jgi:hypothetical protein